MSGASCLLLAAVLFPAAARATLVVEPAVLELRLAGGALAETTLVLTNTSADTLRVRAVLADCRIGPDGAEEVLPAGEVDRSCAGWIGLPEGQVTLAGGESRRLRVRIAVPSEVSGSHWARIRLETETSCLITSAPPGIPPVRRPLLQTVAVPVLHHAPGAAPPAGVLASVEIAPEEGGAALRVRVENAGDRLLGCSGRLELRDARGQVVRKVPLGSSGGFLLPPEGRREILVEPGRLAPGSWSVVTVLDVGASHLLASETRFEVPAGGHILRATKD